MTSFNGFYIYVRTNVVKIWDSLILNLNCVLNKQAVAKLKSSWYAELLKHRRWLQKWMIL